MQQSLVFGEVKPSQCISRSPGLMVRTVHHLAVKWDLGVSMWEKKKKKKHHSVNQEHLRKDPGQMLFSKRLKYETTFRNNSQGKKKNREKRIVP